MAPKEDQLIEQIKNGNTEAFRNIVNHYRDVVYGLCLRMVSNQMEAEELAQDAFLKVFKSIAGYRGESKFSTWLYRITYNTCISHLRKSKLESVDIKDNHAKSDYNSGFSLLVKEDNVKLIKKIINRLKPEDKAIIQLFYLEENSIKEIAQVTGFTNANVKVKLHRAKHKMKSMIDRIGFYETRIME